MRSERSLALVFIVGVITPLASAMDFTDRGSDPAIKFNSETSAAIVGFAGGDWRLLNLDGHAPVKISSISDPQWTPIGEIDVETGAETDIVEVAWWELALPTERFVQFVYRTQEGSQFVPFGAKENGSTIQAFTYEMGGDGNGIDWMNWVDSVFWRELTLSYSTDGGETVFSDPTLYDPVGESQWGGTDENHFGLGFPGDGVNWIQATYKIEVVPVPAPASALALLGPGAMLLRRRR